MSNDADLKYILDTAEPIVPKTYSICRLYIQIGPDNMFGMCGYNIVISSSPNWMLGVNLGKELPTEKTIRECVASVIGKIQHQKNKLYENAE